MMRTTRISLLLLVLAAFFTVPAIAQEEEPAQDCEGEDCPPACPTHLVAKFFPESGDIFMTWTLNSQTDVLIYRAVGDGPFEVTDRHEFPQTRHLDQDVEVGQVYRYRVTAIDDEGRESEVCTEAEVTAIPFFPTWIGLVAGAGLALTSYAVVRRRR